MTREQANSMSANQRRAWDSTSSSHCLRPPARRHMNPFRALVTVVCSVAQYRSSSTVTLNCVRSVATFCPLQKERTPVWGSKKHAARRKVQLQTALLAMDPTIEEHLAPLRARCKEQVSGYQGWKHFWGPLLLGQPFSADLQLFLW